MSRLVGSRGIRCRLAAAGLLLDEAHQHAGAELCFMDENLKGISPRGAGVRITVAEGDDVLHRRLGGPVDLALLLPVGGEQQDNDHQPKGRPYEKHHDFALSV